MTIATTNRQQVSQKVVSAVSILMDEKEIYREDLRSREIVDLVMAAIAEESLFDKFTTLSEEEIKGYCDWIMAWESWGSAAQKMPDDELDALVAAIEDREN